MVFSQVAAALLNRLLSFVVSCALRRGALQVGTGKSDIRRLSFEVCLGRFFVTSLVRCQKPSSPGVL
ncbi:hypothetical protein V5799_003158 [Amblyomma americanum]|uniref:Secreted protein n=1 Tax=Amblyomma americanum TaxID=6943 RepID=A0AAQ4D9R9_AMBAM